MTNTHLNQWVKQMIKAGATEKNIIRYFENMSQEERGEQKIVKWTNSEMVQRVAEILETI